MTPPLPPSRAALVTGAGQGIGRAIALRFVEAGYGVLVAEQDGEAGREAEAELRQHGDALFVRTDVSREAQVRDAVGRAVGRWGRLDVLVCNAGIADPANGPVEELELKEWNRRLGTNLTGAFLCAKHAVPHLRAARGVILTIASTRAFQSEPNTEAYAATKGGLVALTHALAVSLGPDVRAVGIAPGWIAVDDWQKAAERQEPKLSEADHAQHPVGRVGRPDDVAALALFLASERAGFITGVTVPVDGGMTHKMIYAE